MTSRVMSIATFPRSYTIEVMHEQLGTKPFDWYSWAVASGMDEAERLAETFATNGDPNEGFPSAFPGVRVLEFTKFFRPHVVIAWFNGKRVL